jgi:hypothetical protein
MLEVYISETIYDMKYSCYREKTHQFLFLNFCVIHFDDSFRYTLTIINMIPISDNLNCKFHYVSAIFSGVITLT